LHEAESINLIAIRLKSKNCNENWLYDVLLIRVFVKPKDCNLGFAVTETKARGVCKDVAECRRLEETASRKAVKKKHLTIYS
jgi:hypothetical protein